MSESLMDYIREGGGDLATSLICNNSPESPSSPKEVQSNFSQKIHINIYLHTGNTSTCNLANGIILLSPGQPFSH